jgi:ribonuclease Z
VIHSASLINGPFGDPAVFVEVKYRNEAFLFDLGDLRALPPRKLLKIGYIFVSHTHMDHFIGFDHLLRISLGRNRCIRLYGPPGFLKNVEDRLRAYTWNLVANYANEFELLVTEIHDGRALSRAFRCRRAFAPEGEQWTSFDGILASGDFFRIRSVCLDHGTPCLAFRFEEMTRINIKKNVLREMGLPTGSWLLELKTLILRGDPDDVPVRIRWRCAGGSLEERTEPLGLLRERAVKITPGRKIGYVTDALYSEENARRIVEIAAGTELLFIEAPFLQQDAAAAARKHHLTARQAGELAAQAGAKRLVTFHYSPKYTRQGHLLAEEAQRAFSGACRARPETSTAAGPVSPHSSS